MKIAFVYMKGRLDKLGKVRSGLAASDFFYGGIQLEQRGHDVGFFEVDRTSGGSIIRKALVFIADRLFALKLLPSRTYGWLIFAAKDLCPTLNKYDVIVASTTGIAFSLSAWSVLGLIKPPIVGIQGSLLDYKHNWIKKKLNGFLLKRMRTQLLGSENGAKSLRHTYNLPSGMVTVNQFGVDADFWMPGSNDKGDYLLAVGNDGRRDYELLVQSASKINCKILMLTSSPINGEIPANVRLEPCDWGSGNITELKLLDIIKNAMIVVIPLRETRQVAGQSAALQAMACGKPVVLTKTSGLWSETMMKDGENVVFVRPGDVDALANGIMSLLNDPDKRKKMGEMARETVETSANIKLFADRLEQECKELVADGGM